MNNTGKLVLGVSGVFSIAIIVGLSLVMGFVAGAVNQANYYDSNYITIPISDLDNSVYADEFHLDNGHVVHLETPDDVLSNCVIDKTDNSGLTGICNVRLINGYEF